MMDEDEQAEIRAARLKAKKQRESQKQQRVEKFEMIKATLDDSAPGATKA